MVNDVHESLEIWKIHLLFSIRITKSEEKERKYLHRTHDKIIG